ncbi:MAG: 60S ribosomal export protein NMD3 [Methanosarcinales archaeon]
MLSKSNIFFCPKCGIETHQFYGKVCKNCFLKDFKLFDIPKILKAKICPFCGSYFKSGKWILYKDLKDIIFSIVEDSLEIYKNAKDIKINLIPETGATNETSTFMVTIQVDAQVRDIKIKEEAKITVRIKSETCDTCSRISGGYYEGIVQIRAENRYPSQEEREKCIDLAYKVIEHNQDTDRYAFITDIKKLKEGTDIYVGSLNIGRKLCRAIIENFGGKFTESPKLYGRKNGKDLYRISFSVRLPEFVQGDIIAVKNKVIEVKKLSKPQIKGIDLNTWKQYILTSKQKIQKLCNRKDAVKTVLICVEKDIIQILDPDTYKPVILKKPILLNIKSGSDINIVKTSKGIFVLPP